MRLLTPELYCLSALQVTSTTTWAVVSRQLDFNLSRRTGIVFNQINSSFVVAHAGGAQYFLAYCQEVDLDPDNVDVWQGSPTPVAVDYDTSRLLRHCEGGSMNEVTDLTWVDTPRQIMIKEWHAVPLERRPISITPVRHHLGCASVTAGTVVDGQLHIYYHIVELSLEELGILNASRR